MSSQTYLLFRLDKERKEEKERLRLEILDLTKKESVSIFQYFHVQEVYIVGSLVIPNKFSNHSDIDFAVRGLRSEDYFPLLARLIEKLPRPVELIELEQCQFADKLVQSGIRII